MQQGFELGDQGTCESLLCLGCELRYKTAYVKQAA